MAKSSGTMKRSSAMSAGGSATLTENTSMDYVGWMDGYAKLKAAKYILQAYKDS